MVNGFIHSLLYFLKMGIFLKFCIYEISHRKTNTLCFHLYMDSKKQNKQILQNRNGLTDTENKLGYQKGRE